MELVLQSRRLLSDGRTEYPITDRLSFTRCLGLSLAQSGPDAYSIWSLSEALTRAMIEGKLGIDIQFKSFDAALTKSGILANTAYAMERAIWPTDINARALSGRQRRHSRGVAPRADQFIRHEPTKATDD
jgi:hypothetical protein